MNGGIIPSGNYIAMHSVFYPKGCETRMLRSELEKFRWITITVTDKLTMFLFLFSLSITQLRINRFKAIEDKSK